MAFHITISLTDISDKDFTKTMKMAIALACIRNKPEDKTAGEYTEQLCQNYLKKQLVCQENLIMVVYFKPCRYASLIKLNSPLIVKT
jgi:hypothetical protein